MYIALLLLSSPVLLSSRIALLSCPRLAPKSTRSQPCVAGVGDGGQGMEDSVAGIGHGGEGMQESVARVGHGGPGMQESVAGV